MQKILYVDMDNVLVHFSSSFGRIDPAHHLTYKDRLDEVPGIFSQMDPVEGAVESYQLLSKYFDTYILSTSPWENPTAASDKFAWVKKYLGEYAKKRLILSHHKNLHYGDFLVDDRSNNGASEFKGEWIQFGTPQFPDWRTVSEYLLERE